MFLQTFPESTFYIQQPKWYRLLSCFSFRQRHLRSPCSAEGSLRQAPVTTSPAHRCAFASPYPARSPCIAFLHPSLLSSATSLCATTLCRVSFCSSFIFLVNEYSFGVLSYARYICEHVLDLMELTGWRRWRGSVHESHILQSHFILCFLTFPCLLFGLLFILATFNAGVL